MSAMDRQSTTTKTEASDESYQMDADDQSPSREPSALEHGKNIATSDSDVLVSDLREETMKVAQASVVRQGTFERGPDDGSGSGVSGLKVPVIDDEPIRFVSGHNLHQGRETTRSRGAEEATYATTPSSVQGILQNISNKNDDRVDKEEEVSRSGVSGDAESDTEYGKTFLTETTTVLNGPRHNDSKHVGNSQETDDGQTFHQELETLRIQNGTLIGEKSILKVELENLKDTMAGNLEDANYKENAQLVAKEETIRMQSEALDATRNLHALQREFNELKSQVDEIQDGSKLKLIKLDSLEKDKAILTQEIQKLRQTNKEMRNIIGLFEKDKLALERNKQHMQTENQQQHLLFQDLKTEISRLQEEIKLLKEKDEEGTRQIVECGERKEQLNNFLSQISDQTDELQKLRQDAEIQQEHVTGLFNKIYELNKQLDKLLEHNGNLLISLSKERTNCSNLDEKARKLEEDNRKLLARLADMDTRNGYLHVEDEKVRELINRNIRLVDENKKLRFVTTEKDFEITNNQAERRELRTKLETLETKQSDADERMRQLQDWLDEMYVHREELSQGSISERIFNRSQLTFPPRLSGILPDVREKGAQLSVTMNYSTRRKHLQQLRKQKRW